MADRIRSQQMRLSTPGICGEEIGNAVKKNMDGMKLIYSAYIYGDPGVVH